MPIYEYRCDNCGHEFETIQKVSDAPLTTCPACEVDALRKKVSAAAFRLKGGGWYETDFKSDKKRNVAGEERAGDGEAGKSAEAGKDSKGGEKAAETATARSGDKTDKAGKATGDGGKSSGESKGAGKGAGEGGGKSATKAAD